MNPLVSVIVPFYNHEDYLGQAIESILSQHYSPLQIILVDDGSTDGSADIARQYLPKIEYHYKSNGGAASARNLAIKMATGGFLAFLDSDDVWFNDKLILQIQYMIDHSEVEMCFTHIIQFHGKSAPESRADIDRRIAQPGISLSALLIKRDSFMKVGLLSESYAMGEFIEWFARADEMGLHHATLPMTLAGRRIHATNMGITSKSKQLEYVRILKSMLDRRRER